MTISDRARRAIDAVLENEGGYVDHPHDRGGPTNFGITLATLIEHRGVPVLASDVRDMAREEAIEIYHERYFEKANLDLLEREWLARSVLDMAVNHGIRRAVLILQKACGTTEDGILGPITAGVANSMEAAPLKSALIKERSLFYGRIVRNDPTQAVFLVGWLKRAFEAA